MPNDKAWSAIQSAITYLLGKMLIQNERKLHGLLPSFYNFARHGNDSEEATRLARAFNRFSSILRSTCDNSAADDDGSIYRLFKGISSDRRITLAEVVNDAHLTAGSLQKTVDHVAAERALAVSSSLVRSVAALTVSPAWPER